MVYTFEKDSTLPKHLETQVVILYFAFLPQVKVQ